MGLTLFLFFLGFISAALAEKYSLGFLRTFPRWFLKKALSYLNTRPGLLSLTLLIFLFNSTAILLYMLSGILIFGPFLIAFLSGLNVGLIFWEDVPIEFENLLPAKEPEGSRAPSLFSVFFIAATELFVFSFALSLGMSLALLLAQNYTPSALVDLLFPRIKVYLSLGPPFLLLSAILEARLIKEAL